MGSRVKRVFVSTAPFGSFNKLPLELLDSEGLEIILNPLGRRLTEDELIEFSRGCDALIAGTEKIGKAFFKNTAVSVISRVGIGLDNIDLLEARAKGVEVCYTPDAPAPAVAELTIGLMLSLLRGIHIANMNMHSGLWQRISGRRIPDVTIGIIGVGRIGGRVIRRLSGFGSPRLLVNDLRPSDQVTDRLKLEWVDKTTIYSEADIVSLHLPLTAETDQLIGDRELSLMKRDSFLINTARGRLVCEEALVDALLCQKIGGAAIDVFPNEPYEGALSAVDNCLLTCHMGSMSHDCRAKMEIEATEEILRACHGIKLKNPVPEAEYAIQRNWGVERG